MSKEVVFYGERGILNSIILDMQGDISKEKKFLNSIVLGDKSKLEWVDDVCIFRYIIEPNLDGFGTPSLIIEAITKDYDKYMLFIQATLGSYEKSIEKLVQVERLNNDYLPLNYNNTNKTNIQLALLYRFIKAYNNTSFDKNDFKRMVVENESISKNYNDNNRRALENKIMINYWNKHYRDVKEYYFVALTNDSKKIVDDDNLNSNMFPYNNNNMIPPIGNKQWNLDKNKFGILTYDTLLEKKVILKNMGYYKNTSELMWFEPPENSLRQNDESHIVVAINKDRWDENQQTLSNLLKDVKNLDEDFKLYVNNFVKSAECK